MKRLTAIFGALIIGPGLLSACATSLVRDPVPAALVEKAAVDVGAGTETDIRFWVDTDQATFKRIAAGVVKDLKRTRPALLRRGGHRKTNFLALSGGGADGAYGAGYLSGWSSSGKRPTFHVVTGVSAGALIAPFAFLGPSHDDTLKELFTTYQTSDFAKPQVLSGLLGGIAVADDSGLRKLIERYANRTLMRAIAREHARGRRLYVVTTNIDAQRGVVWDMGAIARRDTPASLDLFRRVLLASTSIPGLFPPVEIKVKVNGKSRQELHVDGGLSAQVFFMSPNLSVKAAVGRYGLRSKRTIYVMRNTRIEPEYQQVKPTTLSISTRSVETLIKQQGRNDLLSIYFTAQRNRMAYRLTSIPPDFNATYAEPFDRSYMRALFARGEQEGTQNRWRSRPPQLDPNRR